MPFGWLAAATIGSSIIGAIGSSSAASSQAGAAQNATNTQLSMFNQVMGNLVPYQQTGAGALGSLNYQLGLPAPAYQTTPSAAQISALNINPGQATIQRTGGEAARPLPTGATAQSGVNGIPMGNMAADAGTPGGYGWLSHPFGAADLTANLAPNYQFQLGQGEGQIANAGAASGMSGNTAAGLESFAQNYASNAYQQAFQNYTMNQQNIYGRLGNLAQLGEQASTGMASGAPLFASGISQTIQGLGAANAAGTVGVANAVGGGINNLAGYYALNNMGLGGGGGGGTQVPWDFSYLPPPQQPGQQ